MAPAAAQTMDDDHVIATYDVYLTDPPPTNDPPRCLLVQYPDRNARRPYGPLTHQSPLALRLKPDTGLVELDVPIDTAHNYNRSRGSAYSSALKNSRILSAGGSHGLAGGFNTGPGGRVYRTDEDGDVDMKAIPRYGEGAEDEQDLNLQTLGGKIAKSQDGDPIYMLGMFKGSDLHLSHLDSLVQVRPQLQHLDAADEVSRGVAFRAAKKGEQMDNGLGNPKPETRALEMKVKSADEKFADKTRKKSNAEMLTEIQAEPWQTYTWLDSSDPAASQRLKERMIHAPTASIQDSSTDRPTPALTSALSPTEYLDFMSAPRIDLTATTNKSHNPKSSLGLMGKVRGRERERRRRKKNDADRKAAAEEATRKATLAVENGDMNREDANEIIRLASQDAEESEGSTSGSDVEAAEEDAPDDDIQITKIQSTPQTARRGNMGASNSAVASTSAAAQMSAPPKRPRGRPRKSTAELKSEPMVIED